MREFIVTGLLVIAVFATGLLGIFKIMDGVQASDLKSSIIGAALVTLSSGIVIFYFTVLRQVIATL